MHPAGTGINHKNEKMRSSILPTLALICLSIALQAVNYVRQNLATKFDHTGAVASLHIYAKGPKPGSTPNTKHVNVAAQNESYHAQKADAGYMLAYPTTPRHSLLQPER